MKDKLEQVATELQIDRSNWQLVTFGDVAIQQKQSVDRENTDIIRYVKGEHMYSDDLHLREWGELKDEYLGPAFIRKFEEGDILYGSRRTYLRKVVLAPFEGITSNTTFVVKANEELINRDILPFVMKSEGFTEHSVRNSKGSVNPYVNWKDLANYEFLLPPKEQQAELAELLWSMDEVIEKALGTYSKCTILENSSLKKIKKTFFHKFVSPEENASFTEGRIDSFFVLQRGFDLTKSNAKPGKIPVISSSGISYYHNESKCDSVGVITGRKGKLGGVYFINEPHWPHDTSLWVKDFKGNDPKFIYWFLRSINLEVYNAATAVPTLNRNVLHPLKVRFPDLGAQVEVRDKMDLVDAKKSRINNHINASRQLQKSLVNKVF